LKEKRGNASIESRCKGKKRKKESRCWSAKKYKLLQRWLKKTRNEGINNWEGGHSLSSIERFNGRGKAIRLKRAALVSDNNDLFLKES